MCSHPSAQGWTNPNGVSSTKSKTKARSIIRPVLAEPELPPAEPIGNRAPGERRSIRAENHQIRSNQIMGTNQKVGGSRAGEDKKLPKKSKFPPLLDELGSPSAPQIRTYPCGSLLDRSGDDEEEGEKPPSLSESLSFDSLCSLLA
jgi:hypothetical protein